MIRLYIIQIMIILYLFMGFTFNSHSSRIDNPLLLNDNILVLDKDITMTETFISESICLAGA